MKADSQARNTSRARQTAPTFQQSLSKAAAMMNSPKIRVTLIMPKSLDTNVELFCHVSGRKKLDVISTAVAEFLEKNGVAEPYTDQTPQLHQLLRGQA